ncbi:MAG: hypothetical protein JSR60_14835 [Proteobacteria bacterium]|nr:hypothetical protein [Pseudomonadota bacterium]
MKSVLLILAFVLLPVAATGGDASLDVLEPGPAFGTTNSEYDGIVRAVFPEAFMSDVRADMLSVPSMALVSLSPAGKEIYSGEAVVGVKTRLGTSFIFASEAHTRLWDYTAEGLRAAAQLHIPLRPARQELIRPKHCERPIDASLAMRIIQSWNAMLQLTHADPNSRHGADGDTYFFSAEIDGRTLSGSTWSPGGGKLAALTNLANDMEAWCMRERRLSDLRTDLGYLETLLKRPAAP